MTRIAAQDLRRALALAIALKVAALLILYAGHLLVAKPDYKIVLWMTRPATTFLDNLANFDGAWFIRAGTLGYRRLAAGDYNLAEETAKLRVMDQLGYDQGRWPPEPPGDRFDRGYGYRHWPLFPWLIGAGYRLGLDPVLWGVILANLFTLAYGLLFYVLAREDLDHRRALLALALSQLHPGAYALSAVFNESLFLLLAASAMLAARKGRFGLAGLSGLLASLTRIDGVMLTVPLAYEWLTQRAEAAAGGSGFADVLGWANLKRALGGLFEWPGVWWAVLLPAGTLIAVAVFYLSSGDALIWTKVHEVNRYGHVNWPWLMLYETYCKGPAIWMKELPLHALLLLTVILSFRRVRGAYWVWMAMFFLYHASNANHSYLRYQVQCLPLFIALAVLARERKWLGWVLLGLFLAGFAFFGARFINGYWVA